MNKMLKLIDDLYDRDAHHRKGFAIRDATPTLAAASGCNEMGELATALEIVRINSEGAITPQGFGRVPAIREELADVYAIVVHLCYMLDIGPEELEQIAIAKVKLRFNQPHL